AISVGLLAGHCQAGLLDSLPRRRRHHPWNHRAHCKGKAAVKGASKEAAAVAGAAGARRVAADGGLLLPLSRAARGRFHAFALQGADAVLSERHLERGLPRGRHRGYAFERLERASLVPVAARAPLRGRLRCVISVLLPPGAFGIQR
ncbi:unnamed protein product, partial [Effrenium voratum]